MIPRISLIAIAAVLSLGAQVASAVPVTYQFDSFTNSATRFTLANAPIVGGGDLEFDAAGNFISGSLQLPAFHFLVDANNDGTDDVRFDVTATSQTLAAAALLGGAIDLAGGSASGSTSCALLPGGAPSVCPPPAAVQPFGSDSTGVTAVVTLTFTYFNSPTDFAGTVAGITTRTSGGATTVQNSLSSFASAQVPEPSVGLLLAPIAIVFLGRRRASASSGVSR